MSESPIVKTMDEMLAKLKDAVQARAEAEKQITEYTNAIKALAKVVEDEEISTRYLVSLEEVTGKPGFLDAIRSVLRGHPGFTPPQIRWRIDLAKKMDLSAYSNPMASIHTTLRRMVDSGEVETFTDKDGNKAYRLTAAEVLKREIAKGLGRMTPPPGPPKRD